MNFKEEVEKVCEEIKALLIEKNEKYGNSALNPIKIFSKNDRIEQIKVRIDDKLTRIRNLNFNDTEDSLKDLMGYLVLLRIALNNKE